MNDFKINKGDFDISEEEKHENQKITAIISYSQDNEAHKKKVVALAKKLRLFYGIHCEIDQFNANPDLPWPEYGPKLIRESKYVLVAADETFWEKANDKKEQDGKGAGVKAEWFQIRNILYKNGSKNLEYKFIPILFDKEDAKYIPDPLQGFGYIVCSTVDGEQKLYQRLRGLVSAYTKPPVNPIMPDVPPQLDVEEDFHLQREEKVPQQQQPIPKTAGGKKLKYDTLQEVPFYKRDQIVSELVRHGWKNIGLYFEKYGYHWVITEGDLESAMNTGWYKPIDLCRALLAKLASRNVLVQDFIKVLNDTNIGMNALASQLVQEWSE